MKTIPYLVLGLQESGKTTFAAALWYLLDASEVSTSLTKGLHSGNYEYLEEIAKLWGSGWAVGRTTSTRTESIQINLHEKNSKTDVSLEFTDLSGESFEKLFALRSCTKRLAELAETAEGILLFVSARRKADDTTILDLLKVAGRQDFKWGQRKLPDFDPANVPHEVMLVDILQILSLPPFPLKNLRIAVIVSAWDLSRWDSPELWLQKTMPLLDQYLRNNSTMIDLRVYGVSAQGSDLPKKDDAPNVLEKERKAQLDIVVPSKRIRIVARDLDSHDLTLPIYWLSGFDNAR